MKNVSYFKVEIYTGKKRLLKRSLAVKGLRAFYIRLSNKKQNALQCKICKHLTKSGEAIVTKIKLIYLLNGKGHENGSMVDSIQCSSKTSIFGVWSSGKSYMFFQNFERALLFLWYFFIYLFLYHFWFPWKIGCVLINKLVFSWIHMFSFYIQVL